VRTSAPLFVSEEILNSAALPYLETPDKSNEEEMREFLEFLESVKPEDFTGLD